LFDIIILIIYKEKFLKNFWNLNMGKVIEFLEYIFPWF